MNTKDKEWFLAVMVQAEECTKQIGANLKHVVEYKDDLPTHIVGFFEGFDFFLEEKNCEYLLSIIRAQVSDLVPLLHNIPSTGIMQGYSYFEALIKFRLQGSTNEH